MLKKIIILCLLWPALSVAQEANLKVISSAEKEIKEVNAEGVEETKVVPVSTVVPGDIVVYTIAVENQSDKPADNVAVTDPIPAQMAYIEGSAFGSGMEITFSVDGGKTYDVPENLKIETADGMRTAMADEYTNIRWVMAESLPPGTTNHARFRARLR